MDELFSFFCSIEFLGILFLSAGFCFLLIPAFYSWYASKPRYFWFTNLTYADADTQSYVRSVWISGIVFFAIGLIVISIGNPDHSGKIGGILFEITYLIVCAWLMQKAILLMVIIVLSLWNWIVHGKFIFKKEMTTEGNTE